LLEKPFFQARERSCRDLLEKRASTARGIIIKFLGINIIFSFLLGWVCVIFLAKENFTPKIAENCDPDNPAEQYSVHGRQRTGGDGWSSKDT
jgi:hypothetical protein